MSSKPLSLIALCIAAALAAPHLRASEQDEGGGSAVPVLVSAEWLAERLGDRAVVVLHVHRDEEPPAEHIPGSVVVPLSAIAADRGSVRTELPDAPLLEEALEAAGISDGTRVVVYGEPLPAARAFMTLEYAGLRGRVGLLDGGLPAWRESGRPVSREARVPERGRLTVRPRPDVVVDAQWVLAHGRDPDVLLLDVRSREEIEKGRIPSARHLFWRELLAEAPATHVRGLDEITRLLAGPEPSPAGPARTIVAYCATGMRASVAYVAARAAGLELRLYDGSFTEWAQDPSRPVEPCC
jgi:thiosulfate/3-mercaptopyruvate sulfurtransferase